MHQVYLCGLKGNGKAFSSCTLEVSETESFEISE